LPRLASLKGPSRDGVLAVVSADHSRSLALPGVSLQGVLEQWDLYKGEIAELGSQLDAGAGEPLVAGDMLAALPRAYQWCEGSTYLSHMERCRAARGADLPPGHGESPAVLQGSGDRFLSPAEPIPPGDPEWGLDLEGTVAVVVDDVPAGVGVEEAGAHVRLVLIANDLTFRNILPLEFAKGVGFFQAKPLRVLSPLAVTPEELGPAWDGRLLHATMEIALNDEPLGSLDTGADAAFDFPEVIAYAARTRPLAAGTVVGTGTVSNRDEAKGAACLAEKRALQLLAGEEPSPYLVPGDTIRIEALSEDGASLFGAMAASVAARSST